MFECVLKCLIAWPANANQLTLKPIKLSNVAKFPLMSQRFLGPIAVLLVCFLSPFFSYAQYHKHDLRFTRLTDEIGFFNTGINDILEDRKGFVWVASWSGLARHDGYKVELFRQQPGNVNGLKSSKITTLFEDSKGNLWIGSSYTGFYRFDREREAFEQYANDPNDMNSLSNNNVSSIIEDEAGMLWIGTEQGLNRFDPTTKQFLHYKHDPSDRRSLSHNFVYSIAQTADGSLWVGTEEGLNRLVEKDGKEYFVQYDLAPPSLSNDIYLAHNFIYRLIPSEYHPNTIWACTSVGLKKIQFSEDFQEGIETTIYDNNIDSSSGLSHPHVRDLLEESAESIWIATMNGLNNLNLKTGANRQFWAQPNTPDQLSSNLIHCISSDRLGNIWLGLDKGVNRINLAESGFYGVYLQSSEQANNGSVSSLVRNEAKDGLWVSTKGEGLFYLPLLRGKEEYQIAQNYRFSAQKMGELSDFISELLIDQQGWLWVATDGAGVFKIKENAIGTTGRWLTNFEQFTKSDYLRDDYVQSILETQDGNIWIGYWDQSLTKYSPTEGTFKHFDTSKDLSINFKEYPIVHLAEEVKDDHTFLWVGTRGDGVYKLRYQAENEELELIEHFNYSDAREGSISNNFINDLFIDSQGKIWIGTDSGLNLLKSDTDQFSVFFEEHGLQNNTIQSILEDESGKIWVSTHKGVSSLAFTKEGLEVKNYDRTNGLLDNYFNDESAILTPDGSLVYGGVNGISIIEPSHIFADTYAPKISISRLFLSNQSVPIGPMKDGRTILEKSISETSHLVLRHSDNMLSFEYTGLYFGASSSLSYAYKLDGFDTDWVYKDAASRTAHYTNLPHGNYTFLVKVASKEGIWSEPAQIEVTITPPFWLTWWAYILYVLLFAGLAYTVYRTIKLRSDLQHSLLLERLESDKLKEINQLKLQFFTNISHELRTPLTLIISPLEDLLEGSFENAERHRLFTRMHFNANRLLSMINQLLDIRKSEAGLLKLRVTQGNIVIFVREIWDSFRNLATQRKIDFNFHTEEQEILAWFDYDQLEKVLFNLLSNAFKFTQDGGRISINITQEHANEEICIKVEDEGIGIPENQVENIFDRFYQVEQSRKWARKSGTGIGLSLAKTIIEKHNGRITVQSKEEVGTAFFIFLKTGSTHFAPAEILSGSASDELASTFVVSDMGSAEASIEPVEVIENEVDFDDEFPTILIVEDNADIRSYLRSNLQADYNIIEAADGIEGMNLALANPPTLILADIAMPKMDGIELCSAIKTNPITSHIPFVLLTARTSLVFKIESLTYGADDYITKPFNMRLLSARIKNLIDGRKALRQRYSKSIDLHPSEISVNSLDDELISQLKKVIEDHIDDGDFSVDQLASSLNMSRMQLYRKLKAIIGKSPIQLIRGFRLQRAAQLLKTGQYNVADVTYMVGYVDLRSFRKQFKKEFGVSPSSYPEDDDSNDLD
jgi:signal transduction histidine kinase/ligand-binding sensor domain-containing protein/DNA-binding response OmpR family regulator